MSIFRFSFLLSISLSITFGTQAQPGCPDPQAVNYDPAATQNDGSCLYPTVTYVPEFRASLGNNLNEISGLQYADGEWWGHNDSGSDPEFFSINPDNGVQLKKVGLKNAKNRDWEDIAADNANLYLGDFGNNTNDRQNLGIYKVPFERITNGSSQNVNEDEYSFIPFSYPDQLDYSTQPESNTVFDCEAMVFDQGKLQLFTKNRRDYKTTHYRVDPLTGFTQNIETLETDGLISGAGISSDGKLIALVGYDLRGLPKVFCWLLWDWPAGTDLYFSGNKRRIEFGSALNVGQVESIAFSGSRSGYIANERTEYNGVVFVPQSTRYFDFSDYVPQSVATQEPASGFNQLKLYPNPSTGSIVLETRAQRSEDALLEVFNAMGVIVKRMQGIPSEMDLSALAKGIYQVRVSWADGAQEVQKLILR